MQNDYEDELKQFKKKRYDTKVFTLFDPMIKMLTSTTFSLVFV